MPRPHDHCHRCGCTILAEPLTLAVTSRSVPRGLPDPLVLCPDCREALVRFTRGDPESFQEALVRFTRGDPESFRLLPAQAVRSGS